MMAFTQVVETSVNTNNSPSQDYTTNLDDHSNHNIDSPGFKAFTVIYKYYSSNLPTLLIIGEKIDPKNRLSEILPWPSAN